MCIHEFSMWRTVSDGQAPIRNAETLANFNAPEGLALTAVDGRLEPTPKGG